MGCLTGCTLQMDLKINGDKERMIVAQFAVWIVQLTCAAVCLYSVDAG